MNRILYIDYTSHGSIHEIYNSSSALMLSYIFDEVHYYASRESINATKRMFESDPVNITYHKLFVSNPDKSRFHLFLFYFLPILGSLYFLVKAKKADVIFFNSNPPWAFPFINKFARFIKNKIIVVFHGELEIIVNNKKRLNRFSQKSISLLTKQTFKISTNLYISCLGEGIKKRLISFVSDNVKNQIIHFEHTAIFKKPVQNKVTDKEKIKIGITGTVNPSKPGWKELLNLASLLQNIPNVELYVIGRIYCDPFLLSNAGVKYIQGAESNSLSRYQIDNKISEMDYIAYLYPRDSHQLTASGAVFDAINAERYILALKNHYFVDLFNTRICAGSLFENINGLVNFIEQNRKNMPKLPYAQIKHRISPQVEATKFKQLIKELKIVD